MFERWARAVEDAARSQTPRLIIEMALLDLCFAEPHLPLGDLLDRLGKLESRLAGAGSTAGPSRSSDPRPRLAVVPPPPKPAPPAVAPPADSAAARPAAAAAPETDVASVWRRTCEAFGHRPSIAAALEHAEVASWEGGQISLVFDQKLALDQTARSRPEIERVVSQIVGSPTRIGLELRAADARAALLRSGVDREADAVAAEQRQRESEARQHPMIRKAQELFGVAPKEIKTQ
jgi:DNA polymerase-3 subunit gamma/tau